MKTKKLLLIAGTGALAYYMFKNKFGSGSSKQPGLLSRFIGDMKQNIKKPLDRVDDQIAEPDSTITKGI